MQAYILFFLDKYNDFLTQDNYSCKMVINVQDHNSEKNIAKTMTLKKKQNDISQN